MQENQCGRHVPNDHHTVIKPNIAGVIKNCFAMKKKNHSCLTAATAGF